jgi:hypothetical protein
MPPADEARFIVLWGQSGVPTHLRKHAVTD